MKKLIFFSLAILLSSMSFAKNECTLKIVQNQTEIPPSSINGWEHFKLKKDAFDIVVTPDDCDPILATLTNLRLIQIVHKLPQYVISSKGYGYAHNPDNLDVLECPSRENIVMSASDIADEGRNRDKTDVYEQAEELLQTKSVVDIKSYGCAAIFESLDGKHVAKIKRMTPSMRLNATMPSGKIALVIYFILDTTNFQSLFSPKKVVFTFE
jgi:hypothetical protein